MNFAVTKLVPLPPLCQPTHVLAEKLRPSAVSEVLMAAWEGGNDAVELLQHYKDSVGWEALPQSGRVGCMAQLHALGYERNAEKLTRRWRRQLEKSFPIEVNAWRAHQRLCVQAERVPQLEEQNGELRRELRLTRRANNVLNLEAVTLQARLSEATSELKHATRYSSACSAHAAHAAALARPSGRSYAPRPPAALRPPSYDSVSSESSEATLFDAIEHFAPAKDEMGLVRLDAAA